MVDESLRVRTENLGWGWEEEPEGTEDAEVVCVCVCVWQSGGHDGGLGCGGVQAVGGGRSRRDVSREASVLSRSHGKQLWLQWISGICCWNAPPAAESSLNECLRPPPPSLGVS